MVVHTDKLRQLFLLRWKLFLRGFRRDIGRLIATIWLTLVGTGLFGSLAVGTFFVYRFAPSPLNEEILFLVLTAIFLLWIVLPIFEFNVNEGLDISKLVLFPLTRAELMLSLVFSTLLDLPIIILLLLFTAVIAGWATSVPVGLFVALAMLVFYIQLIGFSQLVLALLMRTLQSRRFRDVSIIIIVLFSSTCGLLGQFIGRLMNSVSSFNTDTLSHTQVSPYLQWTPPGMVARSIQLVVHGDWLTGFTWLAIALAVSVLALYLWQVVIENSLSAPEGAGRTRARLKKETQSISTAGTETHPVSRSLWERLLSPQILTITQKEFRYYWRDPQLKALLFQSLISSLVLAVLPIINAGGSRSTFLFHWLTVIAPFTVMFAMISFSLNALGLDRQSLTTLFLFPVPPQRILWGKNLAVFAIGLTELLLLLGLTTLVTQNWSLILPALIGGIAGMGIVLGCGNFSSVFFPQRLRQMQRTYRATGAAQSQGGCLRAVMSMIIFLTTLVLLVPVALALGLPIFFQQEWIWALSMPLALVYGVVFHQAVTRLVAPRILNKAPEILAITTRE